MADGLKRRGGEGSCGQVTSCKPWMVVTTKEVGRSEGRKDIGENRELLDVNPPCAE